MSASFPVHPYVPWVPSVSQEAYLKRPLAALFNEAHLPFEHDAITIPPGQYGPNATPDERIEKLADGSIIIGRAVKPESIVRFVLDVLVDDPRGDKHNLYQLGKFIDTFDTENPYPLDGMREQCHDFVWRKKKVRKYDTVQTKQARIGKLWTKMSSYKKLLEKHCIVEPVCEDINMHSPEGNIACDLRRTRETAMRYEKKFKKEIDLLTSMMK